MNEKAGILLFSKERSNICEFNVCSPSGKNNFKCSEKHFYHHFRGQTGWSFRGQRFLANCAEKQSTLFGGKSKDHGWISFFPMSFLLTMRFPGVSAQILLTNLHFRKCTKYVAQEKVRQLLGVFESFQASNANALPREVLLSIFSRKKCT